MEEEKDFVHPKDLPIYSMGEAAKFLHVPKSTLRAWFLGQSNFRSVLSVSGERPYLLSFTNLIEAHVVDAIRRGYRIPLWKVRTALDYVESHFKIVHPLAFRIKTDGKDLFIQVSNQQINITKDGQLAIPEVIRLYLPRIKRAPDGSAMKFFPFVKKKPLRLTKSVVITPTVSSGNPVITGTGIRTAIVFERFSAGESVDTLAEEYGIEKAKVEDAIRYEEFAA